MDGYTILLGIQASKPDCNVISSDGRFTVYGAVKVISALRTILGCTCADPTNWKPIPCGTEAV